MIDNPSIPCIRWINEGFFLPSKIYQASPRPLTRRTPAKRVLTFFLREFQYGVSIMVILKETNPGWPSRIPVCTNSLKKAVAWHLTINPQEKNVAVMWGTLSSYHLALHAWTRTRVFREASSYHSKAIYKYCQHSLWQSPWDAAGLE